MPAFTTRINGPVAVIGDVHGQTEKLDGLLEQLRDREDYHERWIVFIGDLVDRGPDPKGTLERVTDLFAEHSNTAAVTGDHEFVMARALGLTKSAEPSKWSEEWLANYHSESTFESFDVPFGDLDALRETLPEHHVELITELPWSIEHRKYLFVHAGLAPDLSFGRQLRSLRSRDAAEPEPVWLFSQNCGDDVLPSDCLLTVVSGHTPVEEVEFSDQRILVDTCGADCGPLSCVLLPENEVLTEGSRSVQFDESTAPKRKGFFQRLFGNNRDAA